MFSLVLIASVCVCTYVSRLPFASSRHLPLLLRGGEVHLLQVRERERETRVWKRKGNAHTQRAGRRGRMNPHTSHAAVLRRRYAHYGNSHANGRRTSTENTNDNSSTSTRRRSTRLQAAARVQGCSNCGISFCVCVYLFTRQYITNLHITYLCTCVFHSVFYRAKGVSVASHLLSFVFTLK